MNFYILDFSTCQTSVQSLPSLCHAVNVHRPCSHLIYHFIFTFYVFVLLQPHRISVRSVTVNRKTSKDAACTMIIGKDAPLGPSCVRASNVTATAAVISWLPSNSNFQHTVMYRQNSGKSTFSNSNLRFNA